VTTISEKVRALFGASTALRWPGSDAGELVQAAAAIGARYGLCLLQVDDRRNHPRCAWRSGVSTRLRRLGHDLSPGARPGAVRW
jgi:hypothetical protein